MKSLFLFITLISGVGCQPVDPGSAGFDSGLQPPNDSQLVELDLSPGNLSSNDQFTEVGLPFDVTPSQDLVSFQIGAFIPELNGHDPEFLRIEFSSNHIEWVGYSPGSIEIYESEEACRTSEDYCDEVTVGRGTSGYFEIGDSHIAIQNAYCRLADSSYEFIITAVVYDLSFWPVLPISESTGIQVSCRMLEQ